MPSEMRRPGPIELPDYLEALERQLRDEVARRERRSLPGPVRRLLRMLRSVLRPALQSGAMVLTSLAVIVAIGVAPASMREPGPQDLPLAAPSSVSFAQADEPASRTVIVEELVTAVGFNAFQVPDNPDTPRVNRE